MGHLSHLETILREFKSWHPYRGTIEERKIKFLKLHKAICNLLALDFRLEFRNLGDGRRSFGSSTDYFRKVITIRGKLSVITYLHELAHALGLLSEELAQRFALAWFARIYPRLFLKAWKQGTCLKTKLPLEAYLRLISVF